MLRRIAPAWIDRYLPLRPISFAPAEFAYAILGFAIGGIARATARSPHAILLKSFAGSSAPAGL